MASFPQNHQQYLEPPPQPHPQQSKSFRDLYNNMEGQNSQQANYFSNPNLPDHHPPYIPPFQVAKLAPDGVQEENGMDLQWNFGLETKKILPKEKDFLETNTNNASNNNNNSQISVDFLQARSVSTGLGLSLENPRLASSGDSALLGLVSDELDRELMRQDAEIDRYIKLQGDRLRQAVLEKFQAHQLQMISYVEEKVLQKLREKEAAMEAINRKNMELELRIEQLALESNAWQQRAKYNENMINNLKLNLQQVYARSRDSKEGCGDSEIDDTASCCNGRAIDFNLFRKNSNEMKELMTCKVCRVNAVCMLFLPCNHLCLCKECESKLSFCPLCRSAKGMSMEVYM
ncbi:probable BOI-related E3 ubiquitin-protein ligase 2 [Olea europaea var. sylvestris]|uniref:probable BOI-related E3 ubiquitin-protein ligase 2 n=1 Tax=Olea europaea var. sylvestris TaxID=158386 RepID=UPI000C1D0FE3|nr:probable BOI-related E3 ubiquitin-protein ligase 2 [Olea europaea var. sylvestris]